MLRRARRVESRQANDRLGDDYASRESDRGAKAGTLTPALSRREREPELDQNPANAAGKS